MSQTVLITGCSDGGLGSALAIAFHRSGYRVIATARTLSKLTQVQAAGIEVLQLDVLSEESIKECMQHVKSLDILVNNAGAVYQATIAEASIEDAKKMFDLNLWAPLNMIQAFLPLLLKSNNPIIVNHTSVASMLGLPFNAFYSSSKAALANVTTALRGELQPFGFKVVEIKSGNVKSNITANANAPKQVESTSLYYPARSILEKVFSGELWQNANIPAEQWAQEVVSRVQGSSTTYWIGGNASLAYWSTALLPRSMMDNFTRSTTKVPEISKMIQEYRRQNAVRDAFGAAA